MINNIVLEGIVTLEPDKYRRFGIKHYRGNGRNEAEYIPVHVISNKVREALKNGTRIHVMGRLSGIDAIGSELCVEATHIREVTEELDGKK